MESSPDGPPSEPEDAPAQRGPLESEIRDVFSKVAAALETDSGAAGRARILVAQTQAIYRLAREIDDLKAK